MVGVTDSGFNGKHVFNISFYKANPTSNKHYVFSVVSQAIILVFTSFPTSLNRVSNSIYTKYGENIFAQNLLREIITNLLINTDSRMVECTTKLNYTKRGMVLK